MTISAAFEAYRSSPPKPVTLPRLAVGTAVILLLWLLVTVIVLLPGLISFDQDINALLDSTLGGLLMLGTFGGIWIGAWIVMRYLHKEPLSNLFGVSGRLSWDGFRKGFIAVCLTSVLSEILIYMLRPEFSRTALELSTWLLYLIPVGVLCLLQTSSEELLFRGYLMRGLANRFRSPWIWALLPNILFVAFHLTPEMTGLDVVLLAFTIGSLTVALVYFVYMTGNLGVACGIHMGNNLFAFLIVGHQKELSAFTLFKGAAIEDIGASGTQVAALSAISIVCVLLTVVLLAHRSSPLRVYSDG